MHLEKHCVNSPADHDFPATKKRDLPKDIFMRFTYISKLILVCFLVYKCFSPYPCEGAVLLQKENLIYRGAFRAPTGLYGVEKDHFGYGGETLTYNPLNNSFFIIGNIKQKKLFEISNPEPIISDDLSDLNIAKVIQMPIDIANGEWGNLGEDGSYIDNGARPGGFLLWKNKLIGATYAYYDGGHLAYRSHFTASANWSETGTAFQGMYKVGLQIEDPKKANGGFVGGYMTNIPTEWQGKFGGPALTGASNLAVIGRSSLGPSAWVFNPDDIGEKDPAPATMLLGYPTTHPTLGGFRDTSLINNMVSQSTGIVFPAGSDTILFFGRHGLGMTGLGDSCYGSGTTDITLHETLDSNGVPFCYDPPNLTKGGHAYPYVYRVWAFDANDLMKVKNKDLNFKTGEPYKPWDIIPYAYWNLNFPHSSDWALIQGAAYDPVKQRIYISQYGKKYPGSDPMPIIQVYDLELQPIARIKSIKEVPKEILP